MPRKKKAKDPKDPDNWEIDMTPTMGDNSVVFNLAEFQKIQEQREAEKLRSRRKKRRAPSDSSSTTPLLPARPATTIPSITTRKQSERPPEVPIRPVSVAATLAQPSTSSPGNHTLPSFSPSQKYAVTRSPSPNLLNSSVSTVPSSSVHTIDTPPLSKVDFTALITLLAPGANFQGQVRKLCKTDKLDASWLLRSKTKKNQRDVLPPTPLVCVDNMPLDHYEKLQEEGSGYDVLLNSPRSMLASLRTGVHPLDVQLKSHRHFLTEGAGIRVQSDVAERRYQHDKETREAKIDILREEYRYICTNVKLDEVLTFFKFYDPNQPSSSLTLSFSFEGGMMTGSSPPQVDEGWLQMKKEKSQRLLEAQQRKITKAIDTHKELQRKLLESSQKKAGFWEEQERREQEKRQMKEEAERIRQERDDKFRAQLEDMDRKTKLASEKKRKDIEDREAKQYWIQLEAQESRRILSQEKREWNDIKLRAAVERNEIQVRDKLNAFEQKEVAAAAKREQQMLAQQDVHREKREREKAKDAKRKQIFEAARADASAQAQAALKRQADQEEAYQELQATRRHMQELREADSQILQQSKLDHVERQRRVHQFKQLRTIDSIQRKRDRVHRNEDVKSQLYSELHQQRKHMEVLKHQQLRDIAKEYGGDFLTM